MGTQFVTMAYNLTDMFWLGRVGSGAVAASGAAGMYMWLSVGFLLIGRMGAEIGVSQSLGRGDKKTALDYSRNSILIALVLGSLFGLTTIFANKQLIGFFNFNEKEIANAAAEYLFIIGFPMPLFFISSVIMGTYNASGNSRTPFILNSLGLMINVILDPVFIIVLGMGIKGAAIATTISQLVISAVAASRVGSQMEALTWLVGAGFGSAVIAFVGQNYGAGKNERINQQPRRKQRRTIVRSMLVL